MDNDQKLVAFLETLGDDADVEFARQLLEAHDWNMEAALETVVSGGAGGSQAVGPGPDYDNDFVDEEGYRAPIAAYNDQLIGGPADPQQMAFEQAHAIASAERARERTERRARREQQRTEADTIRRSGRSSTHRDDAEATAAAQARAAMEQSASEHRRINEQREQASLAEAIQASFHHRQSEEARLMSVNADAEREEQQEMARAIEASYAEQSGTDVAYRDAVSQAMRASETEAFDDFEGLAHSPAQPVAPRHDLPRPGSSASVSSRRSAAAVSSSTTPVAPAFDRPAAVARPVGAAAGVDRFGSAGGRDVASLAGAAAPRRVTSMGRRSPPAAEVPSNGGSTAAVGSTARPAGRVPSTSAAAPVGSRHTRASSPRSGSASGVVTGSRSAIDRAAAVGVSLGGPPSRSSAAPISQQPQSAAHQRNRDLIGGVGGRDAMQAYPNGRTSPLQNGERSTALVSSTAGFRKDVRTSSNGASAAAASRVAAAASPSQQGDSPTRQAALRPRDGVGLRPPAGSSSIAGRPLGSVPGAAPGQSAAAREAAEADQRRRQVEEAEKEAERRRRAARQQEEDQQRSTAQAAASAEAQAQREAQEREAAEQRHREAEALAAREAEARRQAEAEAAVDLERKRREAAALAAASREKAAQEAAAEEARRAQADEAEMRRQAERAEALRREAAEAEARRQEAEKASQPEEREVDELVRALVSLRKRYKDQDTQGLVTCLTTLKAYINNLAKNPSDSKFQRINMENGAFRNRVAPYDGAIAVLNACGFEQEDGALVVGQAYLKSKGPKLFDALTKVDVIINQLKS